MPFDLDALAARRARLLPDVWFAVRPGLVGQTPELDEDGNVISPDAPEVFRGPGMMSDPTVPAQGGLNGVDDSGVPNQRVLKLGHEADLKPGDVVECASARWSPSLVGDRFIVLHEDERSVALYRRFVVRGSSWSPPA